MNSHTLKLYGVELETPELGKYLVGNPAVGPYLFRLRKHAVLHRNCMAHEASARVVKVTSTHVWQ